LEEKIVKLIEEEGPRTGSEILDALGGEALGLWRACRFSERLEVRRLGSRYLRLDQKVEGFARLSPSILREFMTYTVVGLARDAEVLDRKARMILQHIRQVSESKRALAQGVFAGLRNSLADPWPQEKRICFLIAGDIVYGMAHDVPRPEHSTGKMVKGSDVDLVVVSEDGVSKDFLKELDKAIYQEKYRTLITPALKEEIDYVVKDMARVREQLCFDTFKRMVACKILQEGELLGGSQSLFDEIKSLLVQRGVSEKLQEWEGQARMFRQRAEDYLLRTDPACITKEDLYLFYTSEESEEFE